MQQRTNTRVLLFLFVLSPIPTFCTSTLSQQNVTEIHHQRSTVSCLKDRDMECILDAASRIVENHRLRLIDAARVEVSRTHMARGYRNDDENVDLISSITQKVYNWLHILREELLGMDAETKQSTANSSGVGESRKKKKKEKLKALIKLLIFGFLLKAKITILLKLLSAGLQIKFFLVALAGLVLNAARFFIDLKKSKHPQKVIYYENAHHQHHYEGGEEEWGGPPESGYWGRSYDVEDGKLSPQQIAYAKQRPTYSKTHGEPPSNSYWFS